MCLKTSRKYLQLYFIIYFFIYFLQSGQKSHTTPHAGQGEKKKQKKTRNEKNDRCFVQRINKIRANPFAYFM